MEHVLGTNFGEFVSLVKGWPQRIRYHLSCWEESYSAHEKNNHVDDATVSRYIPVEVACPDERRVREQAKVSTCVFLAG